MPSQRAEEGIFQEICVNTLIVNALAPCVATSAAVTELSIEYSCSVRKKYIYIYIDIS